MKKILFIIFILSLIFMNYKVDSVSEVNLTTDNYFDLYRINTNLTTKNILNYINKEIKIIAIYPKVKNNKLQNYVYTFSNTTNENNINLFINEYRSLLNKNNYIKEASLISFNGIEISKIIVSTNESNLRLLLETNRFSL